MQVRVFESTDMASGLKRVRKELGPDALILSTKTVRNGKLGLLGKPIIEITAAIDNSWPQDEELPAPPAPPAPVSERETKAQSRLFGRSKSPKKQINTTVGGDDIILDYSTDGIDIQVSEEKSLLASLGKQVANGPESELRGEIDELKNLVHQFADQLTGSSPHPDSELNTTLRSRLSTMKPMRDPISELLHNHGVDEDTARTIASVANEQLEPEDLKDKGKIRRFVIQAIESLIEVKPPTFTKSEGQARIALIGPTGVGKTTTLAKLAAHYLSNQSNSVAMITIDTYRIAAVEQLKVYGEIMHLPVDVVISPEQLEEALERHADKSLVLIDTAGRSPRDTLCIQELTSFLKPNLNIERHLVLSAATREVELLDTIKHFDGVGINKTIFTKVDECTRNGVILNVQLQHDAPLSYITNGQRVPEDLLQINRRSVAELIMSHQEGITND